MVFQTLHEIVHVRNGFGNIAENIRVHLHLLIQIAGEIGKVQQRQVQRRQIRIQISNGSIGVAHDGIQFRIHIRRQQPIPERAPAGSIGWSKS